MYREHPFGNPDGARATLEEVESAFVTEYPYGVKISGYQDDFLSARIIVGDKGSGKTVYLRKMQAMLKKRQEENFGIFVDDTINQNLSCTEHVIRFCDHFTNRRIQSEKWNKLWQTAIFVSLGHKFLYDDDLADYISQDTTKELIKLLKSENLDIGYNLSVYDALEIILNMADTKSKADSMIGGVFFLKLKNLLIETVRTTPPIYVFLDSVDLEYEHAPLHWMVCQKGLFYAVMALLEEKNVGEKLHIIISLRRGVYTSILHSEHATKFINESHVFRLDWNRRSIRFFLDQKIRNLSDCYFMDSSFEKDGKTIEKWLKTKNVTNEYGNEERLIDFLIRHTRLVPRDAIIICNHLAKLKSESVHEPDLDVYKWIMQVIYEESATMGGELITICAKNIMANGLPTGAGRYQYADYYYSDGFYRESTYVKLLELLKLIEAPIVDGHFIEDLAEKSTTVFSKETHILDVLWNCGLIGYLNNEGQSIYYTQSVNGELLFPKDKEKYIIQPCVMAKLNF